MEIQKTAVQILQKCNTFFKKITHIPLQKFILFYSLVLLTTTNYVHTITRIVLHKENDFLWKSYNAIPENRCHSVAWMKMFKYLLGNFQMCFADTIYLKFFDMRQNEPNFPFHLTKFNTHWTYEKTY